VLLIANFCSTARTIDVCLELYSLVVLSYIFWQFLCLQPDGSAVRQRFHPNAFPSAERSSCRSIPPLRLRFDVLLNAVVSRWQHASRTTRDHCQSGICLTVSTYLIAEALIGFRGVCSNVHIH